MSHCQFLKLNYTADVDPTNPESLLMACRDHMRSLSGLRQSGMKMASAQREVLEQELTEHVRNLMARDELLTLVLSTPRFAVPSSL